MKYSNFASLKTNELRSCCLFSEFRNHYKNATGLNTVVVHFLLNLHCEINTGLPKNKKFENAFMS